MKTVQSFTLHLLLLSFLFSISTLAAPTYRRASSSTSHPKSPRTCQATRGTASEAYFTHQIGDYYAHIPDAKSCSQKCALFSSCVAFEYLPLSHIDPEYPQNCWLYTQPFTAFISDHHDGHVESEFEFYDQSCFEPQKSAAATKTVDYPKDKVCAAASAVNLSYPKVVMGGTFSGNVQACARYCVEEDECVVFEYSEVDFGSRGWNCHIFSKWAAAGAYSSQAAAAGQAIIAMEGMRTRDGNRLVFERECAAALLS